MDNQVRYCASCRAPHHITQYIAPDGSLLRSCYYCRESAKHYYQVKKNIKLVTEAAILCSQDEELLKLFSNILKK